MKERITHTEYLYWIKKLNDDWNEPSRTDVYLMRLIAEIHADKRKGSPSLDKFKVPFKSKEQSLKEAIRKRTMSDDEKTAITRARWFAALNIKGKDYVNGQGD